jgi:cell division protease FtsH
MVYSWGMSDLGPANLLAVDQEHAQSGMIGRAISEGTAREVDQHMESVLRRFLAETRHQLQLNKRYLVALANALLEKENLTGDEIKEILQIPASSRRRLKVASDAAAPVMAPDIRVLSFPPAVPEPTRGRSIAFWRRRRRAHQEATGAANTTAPL